MCKARQNITAVIYDKRGRVLSIGQNSYVKTHPLQKEYAKKFGGRSGQEYLHAEIAAIIKCKDLSKAHRIFVARYGKDGKPALAKPCVICQGAIEAAGIKEVEHT